jgi:pimeloyl-CoA synthetase
MGRTLSTPPASKATKRVHERKIEALDAARIKTHHAYLIGIFEAGADGCTNDDIAYMIGNISPSTIGKYRRLGEMLKNGKSIDGEAGSVPPVGR